MSEQPTAGAVLDALLAGYRDEWRTALREAVETMTGIYRPDSPASRKALITIAEVAELCSISDDLVYRLFASGEWPALQLGRKWLTDPDLLRPHIAKLIVEQTEQRRARQVRSARRRAA